MRGGLRGQVVRGGERGEGRRREEKRRERRNEGIESGERVNKWNI